MVTPFISICIPVYKQPERLKRLLLSIADQTFRDFEVIISDDSPTHEVGKMLEEASFNFKPIYFHNSPSKGSPENWNYAISIAKGEWIKMMHHDDWFAKPEALQGFVNTIHSNPSADFLFCGSIIFNEKTNEKYPYSPDPARIASLQPIPAYLFHANLIGAPSATIYRRTLSDTYDRALAWLVDIEFYTRVILKHKIQIVPEGYVLTTGEAEHQLSTAFTNNKIVEFREYIYCYNKLYKDLDKTNLTVFRERILFLLQEYKVTSIAEIRKTGFSERLPGFIRMYCSIASLNKNLAVKILGKWIQKQQQAA